MDYIEVYEYTKPDFEFYYILSLIFLFIGSSFMFFNYYKKNGRLQISFPFILGSGMVFFGLIAAITVPFDIAKKNKVMEILKNKEYNVVEGEIENFHPMPKAGKENESFTVNGIFFKYSDYTISYGFNNSSTLGGPLRRNGQQVRISYISDDDGNKILKLELAKNE
jgi:hypothetical protein